MPDTPERTGKPTGLILGIENSCDETAAAVVRGGTEILSSIVASQISLHANFGGVVPELASREHLRNIVPVVRAAIAEAALKHPGLTLHDLDAIAVTRGPGLAGALLVGITYAKALALALNKPLLAINHLEGHIHAVLMDTATRPGPAPTHSTPAISTEAQPPNHVISTEAQRSGETRFSTPTHANPVISTEAQRSGETCFSTPTHANPVISTEAKRSGETRFSTPTHANPVISTEAQRSGETRFFSHPTHANPVISTEAKRSGETCFSTPNPTLALVVSGGHTHLYLAHLSQTGQGSELWHYRNIGRTVDDAAGEAFDKVAKLLGLPYPGGPWIDALAPHGNPRAVPFTFAPIKPRTHPLTANPAQLLNPKSRQAENPVIPAPTQTLVLPTEGEAAAEGPAFPASTANPNAPTFDVSFSGIKTAVLRYTQTHAMAATIEPRRHYFAANPDLKPTPATIADLQTANLLDPQTLDLVASFQHAVVGNLLKQTLAAAEHSGARTILVSGGVSANAELRRRFTAEADRRGLSVAFPKLSLSTDNAAMIAAAAWPRLLAHDLAPDDLTATPQLRLG